MECLHEALQEKRVWKKSQMQSSGTVENLTTICVLTISGFRGGTDGATPPFFLAFLKCFETLTLLYCCMSCKVKFSFEGGGSGGWETRPPFYAFSGSVPVNCSLQCLSNYLSHGEHTSSSVLTIAWKDSVKTTLGWYLTRLRVLAWLCRKEIATAVAYVWLMKGIFTLNPSVEIYFLPFTFPWQGLPYLILQRALLSPKGAQYFP